MKSKHLNVKHAEKKVRELADRYKRAMADADYLAAQEYCREVLKMMPGNGSVLADYALACMRGKDYQQAYAIYLKLFNASTLTQPVSWLDGLAEVCGWLEKKQELRKYGQLSLTLADNELKNGTRYPFPARFPRFYKKQREQHVISFSLYGSDPRYCETLVKNCELAHAIYPEWICRVYFDSTVPSHVLSRLSLQGAELIDMTSEKDIPATLWRFLVVDDAAVSHFIIRDADSLLSEKEAAAVHEWLKSKSWFHHMRDYFTHTDLLLAGMWGGRRGVFKNIEGAMRQFVQQYSGTKRFTDQQFLKHVLWPTIRESLLSHDEIFDFHHAQPFPPHPAERWEGYQFHIGSNASYAGISGESRLSDNEKQAVELSFEDVTVHYFAVVRDHKWFLNLPFHLLDLVKSGALTVRYV